MFENNNSYDPQTVTFEFYDKLMTFTQKRVKDSYAAEDIVQEVIGKLVLAYKENRQIDHLSGWLFKVTRNLINDYYKKTAKETRTSEFEDLPQEEEETVLEASDYITPMMKLLPEDYRTPLMMADIQGTKQAEIAQQLGLSLSATKMRIQRGRKILHDLFFQCCNIEYNEDGSFAHCTLKDNCKTKP